MFVFINCHMCRDAPALGSTKRSYYTMFQEAVACTITDSTDILKQPAPAWPEFHFISLTSDTPICLSSAIPRYHCSVAANN